MAVDRGVSVVIPAYNAEDTIAAAIESVLAQDYAHPVELVVVDDGSTDATADIVRRYPAVVYIHQENAGPASARNHGARVSKGSTLFFTDSDCCPERSWISKMMQGFAQEGVMVVAGSYGIANVASRLARVIHEEIIFRHRVLMPEFPKAFGSYNVAIRREVFEAVGGFNAQYRRASGEDNDLSYKIIARGERIFFQRDACVDHYHQESLPRYLKEQFRHGVWRLRIYVDHPGMMAGDGYTFWKDMIEIPVVAAHLLIFFWPIPALMLLLLFLLFEIVFCGIMMGARRDIFFAGYVLWLRSFMRTAGFFSGFFILLKDRLSGVKKI
jgi:glycosyltransferase involved in cell wall biosynthesis